MSENIFRQPEFLHRKKLRRGHIAILHISESLFLQTNSAVRKAPLRPRTFGLFHLAELRGRGAFPGKRGTQKVARGGKSFEDLTTDKAAIRTERVGYTFLINRLGAAKVVNSCGNRSTESGPAALKKRNHSEAQEIAPVVIVCIG